MQPPTKSAQTRELTTPWPPRYRWLKRSLLIFVAVAGLLIGAHALWRWIAQRRLAAQIAAIHARGEPILVQDFGLINIPDSDNAAWYLRQAAAGIKHEQEIDTVWYNWTTAYTDQEIADLTRWVDDEQATRSMARAARAHPMVAWNIKVTAPAIFLLLPELNTQRLLANTLRTAAFVEHRRGNDAQAVETVRDMRFAADAMQQYYPTIITHLVGIGMDAVASDTIMNLAPDLAVADDSATTRPGASPASRAQVLQLIAELCDERQYLQGAAHSMYGERTFALDGVQLATQNGVPSLVTWIWNPAFQLDIVRIIKRETQVSVALAQPTLPSARALMPNTQAINNRRGIARMTHLLESILMPSLDRFVLEHFRGVTDRRAAAIALAIRLWRVDHAGRWPASLEELIPRYLAAVPIDPFSSTAAPFHYNPNAPGGAVIYSLGDSAVDYGGAERLIRPVSPGYAPGPWDMLNPIYHLTPRPPTTRPISQ